MAKILGLDLGTNSIGVAVRDTDVNGSVVDQLKYFSSVIFPSGVGKGKSGEFSYVLLCLGLKKQRVKNEHLL